MLLDPSKFINKYKVPRIARSSKSKLTVFLKRVKRGRGGEEFARCVKGHTLTEGDCAAMQSCHVSVLNPPHLQLCQQFFGTRVFFASCMLHQSRTRTSAEEIRVLYNRTLNLVTQQTEPTSTHYFPNYN